MRRSLRTLACLAALAGARCFADTPYSVDVSDLWYDPAESGWGINLAQQNDTVFATLFVYGADGKPRWYSASSMTGTRGPNGVTFRGQLAESAGPAQPGPFEASRVTRREVGTITFEAASDNFGNLSYTVDGVSVRKAVQRLTMKAVNASGEYVGYRSARGCGTATDPLSNNPATFRILQSASSFTMTSTVLNETCTYVGTFSFYLFSVSAGSRLGPLLRLCMKAQVLLNVLFRACLGDRGAENPLTSPQLVFVGVKR